jgi:hypothetical protein
MASTEVGFYVQLKGIRTKKRYKCATVFVDHFSCLRFVHLQLNASSEETMAAKISFEQYTAEHGIKILHYHHGNGRFHDNVFSRACHNGSQKLTFCGVNAYSQNGIAERAICNLSESAHKQLLYAHTCWPEAVHFVLLLHALCNAAHLHNSLPVLEDGI